MTRTISIGGLQIGQPGVSLGGLQIGRPQVAQAGGGGAALPVPVPVLGSELLTNGDFSTWSGDNPSSWTVVGESGSDPMVTQVAADGSAGTGAARLYSSAALIALRQAVLTSGAWHQIETNITGLVSGSVRVHDFGTGSGDSVYTTTGIKLQTGRALSSILQILQSTTPLDAVLDNVSAKQLTLASLFSASDVGLTHAITKANVTISAVTQAGVVANLDSASNPANFVIATHNGTRARLTKCVGGTYTDLVSASATYAAGAVIEIRRNAGTNTYELWYNGSQVGVDQTVSDAGIVSNTLHGYFNTYAGNTLTGFSAVAS